MNIEDEIADRLAEELKQSLDDELMADMLVACGWHKVPKQHFYNGIQSENIKLWLQEHCKGNYRRLGSNWVFEEAGDAVNYTLRWL